MLAGVEAAGNSRGVCNRALRFPSAMFFRQESFSRGIFSSTLLNAVSQMLGFAGNLVVAYWFGTRADVDVYYYCAGVVFSASAFFANLNSSVLIPESMRLEGKENRAEASYFLNVFLYGYALFGIVVAAVCIVAPYASIRIVSRFHDDVIQQHGWFVAWAGALFCLTNLGQFLGEILASHRYFALSVMLGILPKVGMLVLLFVMRERWGLGSALVGACVGGMVQILFLLLSLKVRLGWKFRARVSAVGAQVWKNIAFSQVGHLVGAIAGVVPLFLLSSFSEGTLAALGYAQRLAILPALLLINPVSGVLGVKLNELKPREEWQEIDRIFRNVWHALGLVVMPLTAFLVLFGSEVVGVLYLRGRFDDESAQATALFFRIFAAGIPFMAATSLTTRLFIAWQRVRLGMICQIINRVSFLLLSIAGVGYLGSIGYPIADFVTMGLYQVALWVVVERYFCCVRYKKALVRAGRIIFFSSIGGAFALAVSTWVGMQHAWADLVIGGMVLLLFCLAQILLFADDRNIVMTGITSLVRDAVSGSTSG